MMAKLLVFYELGTYLLAMEYVKEVFYLLTFLMFTSINLVFYLR
jgi:hypothetical protein